MPTLFLALWSACVHTPPSTIPAPVQGEPALVAEGMAAPPFDAEALRTGIPVGTQIRTSITQTGAPEVEHRWEFVASTALGTTVHMKNHDAAGTLLDDASREFTWVELVGHATFPALATVRTDAVYDGPMGHLDTWLYTVTTAGEDGVMLVERYEFARSLPGPPVLYTIERQGEETFRMQMLERK
jgi:hypothetical protein